MPDAPDALGGNVVQFIYAGVLRGRLRVDKCPDAARFAGIFIEARRVPVEMRERPPVDVVGYPSNQAAGAPVPDQNSLTIPFTQETAVRCPQCHSDRGLHFDEVSLIDPGRDIVPLHAVGSEGLSVVTATIGDGTVRGRRHQIILPHWCESCGHRGEIVLRQQNGQTFGQYREVAAAPGSGDGKRQG